MTENEIAEVVVEAAVKVHREPSPGLLETVYELVTRKVTLSRRGEAPP